MSTNAMIVAIVAIAAWAAIRVARYRAGLGDPRHRHRRQEPSHAVESPREQELLGEIEQLRERVKVLERIATEDRQGKAVAAEIESLRDR